MCHEKQRLNIKYESIKYAPKGKVILFRRILKEKEFIKYAKGPKGVPIPTSTAL